MLIIVILFLIFIDLIIVNIIESDFDLGMVNGGLFYNINIYKKV